MTIWLMVALGGAMGAVARYGLGGVVHGMFGHHFPYGTLAVNMLGSFVLGLIYVVVDEKHILGPQWRALVGVGLLGALTTFSTFSLETIKLLEAGSLIKAILNTVANLVLCLVLTWIAIKTGRQWG